MWFAIADYAEAKKCRERQSTGRCGCQRRRGTGNPCDDHEATRQAAMEFAMDGTPSMSVEGIQHWLDRYHCLDSRHGGCSHPACRKVRELLGWLRRIALKPAA